MQIEALERPRHGHLSPAELAEDVILAALRGEAPFISALEPLSKRGTDPDCRGVFRRSRGSRSGETSLGPPESIRDSL